MRWTRRLLGLVLFVAILVLGWRFAADHAAVVVIKSPVSRDVEISLWVALIVAFGLGAIVAGSAAAYQMARMGLLARRYRKLIRNLEAEVHQLRSLPLSEDEPAPPSGPEASPGARRALGRGA